MNIKRWLSAWVPRFRDFMVREHSELSDVQHQGGRRYLEAVAELVDGSIIHFYLHPYSVKGYLHSELAMAGGRVYAMASRMNALASSDDMEVVVRQVGLTKFYGIWAPTAPKYKLVRIGHPLDYIGRPFAGNHVGVSQ